jgi:RNA polymerase sigma-70 factor (ECF subfamily)
LHADDLKLARSLVTGDEKMFNQFFEQFFPRLYRFAFSRLSDESIVEDVVQSTLMNAMRGMKNYRGEASHLTGHQQLASQQHSSNNK